MGQTFDEIKHLHPLELNLVRLALLSEKETDSFTISRLLSNTKDIRNGVSEVNEISVGFWYLRICEFLRVPRELRTSLGNKLRSFRERKQKLNPSEEYHRDLLLMLKKYKDLDPMCRYWDRK